MNASLKWMGVGLIGTMLTVTGCGLSQAASPSANSTTVSASAQDAGQNGNNTANAADTSGSQNNSTSAATGSGNNTGTGSDASTANGVHYTNARYGFSVRVPSDFDEAPPPQDGGGQGWYSQNKSASIKTFGEFNVNKDTVKSELASLSATMQPTFQESGSNWLVVTGYKQSNIVYDKVYVGKTYLYELQIEYPKSEQNAYGDVVKSVSTSFQPGTLS